MLAGQAAGERGTPASIGLVAAAGARVALVGGAFDLAQAGLDAVTMPASTPETMQLAGFLALRRSVVAAADRRSGEVEAPLAYAAELAARTGEGNAYGLSFGPANVGLFTTGATTAWRWPGYGDATTTRCGRCAVPRRSHRIACCVTRSSATPSPCCSDTRAGAPRPTRCCGA